MFAKRITLSLIGLMIVLSACNLPSRTAGAGTPDLVQTYAAETVQVALTQIAGTMPAASLTSPAATVPPTSTVPPPPPTLPPPTALPPTPIPCDKATFIQDVTIPDNSVISPGVVFAKTWRLRNDGSCTWTAAYAVVFTGGTAMNAPASWNLTGSVAPGQTLDITFNLTAPLASGTYRAEFKLRNPSGALFGVGTGGATPFWVQIVVNAPTPTPTSPPPGSTLIYSFTANYCTATWMSGAGVLPCPGGTGDASGFVVRLDNPTMENGLPAGIPGLETHPQWVDDGGISGRFPAIIVQSGFRFRTMIGCLGGGAACNVNFQFNYRANGGPLQSFGTWNQTYDGSIGVLDIDLATLVGASVEFVLAVAANGSAAQDWAVWVDPRIVK